MISLELFNIAKELEPYIKYESKEIEKLIKSVEEIGKSWSGSWIGYQSRVYYNGFIVPPPGKSFSKEWGLMDRIIYVDRGDWKEFYFDDVVSAIYKKACNPDLKSITEFSKKTSKIFNDMKASALSKIYAVKSIKKNEFLTKLIKEIEEVDILSKVDVIAYCTPKGQVMTRDTRAASEGLKIPPHLDVLCELEGILSPFKACKDLMELILKLANHFKDIEASCSSDKDEVPIIMSKKIFIVHGHDESVVESIARFLERLKLEPIILHEQASSGKTVIEKIEEYAKDACFGVVLYTPCDQGKLASAPDTDMKNRARQNVVFEHGYLNGKLGRSKVAALVKGKIELPNDISGVVYIEIDGNKWKLELANEIKQSGVDIDMNNCV